MKYLIVGLGNIGAEYDETRHNIGFEVLDRLAAKKECEWSHERHAHHTLYKFKGRQLHLIKPTTYMNLSGKAVKYWMQELKIPQENILIIVDDLAIPFGKLRLRGKGSDAGHNGLKDINACLGNQNYARLRFGIGDNFAKGKQINYVLGKWSDEEYAELSELINKSIEAIHGFSTIGLARTMNSIN